MRAISHAEQLQKRYQHAYSKEGKSTKGNVVLICKTVLTLVAVYINAMQYCHATNAT